MQSQKLNTLEFVVTDEQPTPEILLAPHFEFTPSGLIILGKPPKQAFDLLLAHLAVQQNSLALQTGDAIVAYHERFSRQDYERIAATLHWQYAPSTIEDWAVTCRSVPLEIRNGLSIYFYKVVAPLRGRPEIQCQLLADCKNQEMSHAAFEQYVYRWRRDNAPATKPPPAPPTYASDVKEQLTQELYQSEIRYQETVSETERLRQAMWEVIALTWV